MCDNFGRPSFFRPFVSWSISRIPLRADVLFQFYFYYFRSLVYLKRVVSSHFLRSVIT